LVALVKISAGAGLHGTVSSRNIAQSPHQN
jgi:hypothetical protein